MVCPKTNEKVCYCAYGKNRELFTAHVIYTVLFMKAAIFHDGDVHFLEKRLLRNQKDIGEFLGSFTTSLKGEQLTTALKEHIKLAAAAVLSGGSDKAVHEFLEQGNDVARCVTALCPDKLDITTTREAFRMHNKHVLKLAVIYMKSKFSSETAAFDAYLEHMLEVADLIFYAVK
jgi:hypothetical protein